MLNFKCILNGCASNVKAQAEELNGFMDSFLDGGTKPGSTLLFYAHKEDRQALLDLVPTSCATLVLVDRFQPETILDALQCLEGHNDTALYLFPAGFAGSELAVRWAFRRKGSSLVQVEQIDWIGDGLLAKKKAYAGHALATFRLIRQPYCISPAKGMVDRLPVTRKDKLQITDHDLTGLKKPAFVKDFQWIPAEQTRDRGAAKLLIVGGRGLGTRENVQRLKEIADALGAEFGISRPVALNAWGPIAWLIGVSGTVVRPEICIAAGVSGAAAFYAGIEKSKFIIAINIDPRARIVKAADVAVIDDYRAVMDELIKLWDH